MKLGLSLSYVTTEQELRENIELAVAADEIGLDVVWVAEAYGSDAVTVLAAIAARTSRIGLGSGVLQIPARTPTMTAMTAATLDTLSGGRFRLGLGVSGPQVSEGWHGVRYTDPLGRTREYVEIVRKAWSRRRVTADGEHFTLPLPGGEGKPLILSIHPYRDRIPVYLAAIGPKNLELTGQIADGWLGIFFDPRTGRPALQRIFDAASAAGRDPAAIDISVSASVAVHADPRQAADAVRSHAALYLGGMGSKKTNFYHRNATAMGYGAEADLVQERFLSRDYAGAAAAVPFEFLDATCLLGDSTRIAERLIDYRDNGVTTVNLGLTGATAAERIETIRAVHAAADRAGLLT